MADGGSNKEGGIAVITHRCEGGLNQGVSIRFTNRFGNWKVEGDYEAWRMFKAIQDTEFVCGGYYMEHIAKINYCPFCGEKLGDY